MHMNSFFNEIWKIITTSFNITMYFQKNSLFPLSTKQFVTWCQWNISTLSSLYMLRWNSLCCFNRPLLWCRECLHITVQCASVSAHQLTSTPAHVSATVSAHQLFVTVQCASVSAHQGFVHVNIFHLLFMLTGILTDSCWPRQCAPPYPWG